MMLTADVTPEVKQQGLKAGVNDFLTKPFDRLEVVLRINNLLKTRQLHMQLQQHKNTLEEKVRERTEELRRSRLEILQLLGRTSEYRDDMTGSCASARSPVWSRPGSACRRRRRRRSAWRRRFTTSARSASPTTSCLSREDTSLGSSNV